MEAGDDTFPAFEPKPETEGVGAMLRARRLELGMSQADVANVVKLPTRRVEAMEQERWDELPDGPYLRGFLRNIARALNLDATTLVERVDASRLQSRSADSILIPKGVTHITLPRRSGPADERRGGRALVFGAFAFALLAALIAWSGTDSFDKVLATAKAMIAPQAGPGKSSPPVHSEPQATRSETVEPVVQPAAGSFAALPASAASAATAQSPSSATASARSAVDAAPNEKALLFHFNEPSWVEVRAADGTVLLQQLNAAGSDRELDGRAPFVLIVGNAKGVVLRFRGQPVDLAPYTRDQVARFTLS